MHHQNLKHRQNIVAYMQAGSNISAFINHKNQILSCGNNFYGHQGAGNFNSNNWHCTTIMGEKILSLTFGSYHTLCLCESGRVFGWGWNGANQLGSINRSYNLSPTQISCLEKLYITKIAAGEKFSLFLSKDGEVYLTGFLGSPISLFHNNMGNKIKKLHFKNNVRIKSICAGFRHALFLDENGNIHSYGDNECFQLGYDNLTKNKIHPEMICALKDIKFTKIYATYFQSFAISSDDKLFCWGYNGMGQLGFDATDYKIMPRRFDFFRNIKVVKVAAGESHTLVLDSDGRLYGFGENKNGQLGLFGLSIRINIPKIVDITAGKNHSLVITETGEILGFGCNQYAQISPELTADMTSKPFKISLHRVFSEKDRFDEADGFKRSSLFRLT